MNQPFPPPNRVEISPGKAGGIRHFAASHRQGEIAREKASSGRLSSQPP